MVRVVWKSRQPMYIIDHRPFTLHYYSHSLPPKLCCRPDNHIRQRVQLQSNQQDFFPSSMCEGSNKNSIVIVLWMPKWQQSVFVIACGYWLSLVAVDNLACKRGRFFPMPLKTIWYWIYLVARKSSHIMSWRMDTHQTDQYLTFLVHL